LYEQQFKALAVSSVSGVAICNTVGVRYFHCVGAVVTRRLLVCRLRVTLGNVSACKVRHSRSRVRTVVKSGS
jgi:hypothetical protein